MNEKDHSDLRHVTDEFVVLLTGAQNRLYLYILTLLPDRERAQDVLQQTNLVLWRKAEKFQAGTSFNAWACKVAYFEVLAERRRRHRDRHVFDDGVLEVLSAEVETKLTNLDEQSSALEECLGRLTAEQRAQLAERYSPGGSVKDLAESLGKSRTAVAVALHRIRQDLLDCMQSKLGTELNR